MIKLIDTHAHLNHVENVEVALKEASEAGVAGVVAVGIDLASNKKNLEIKKKTKNPAVFLAFGVHPESLENSNPAAHGECFSFIKENIKEAAAIGEIGLDYWYKWAKKDDAKKKEQREIFDAQLQMAREYNLPAVIHSRGSWRDCFDMAKAAKVRKAVFHWYSGPTDILDEIINYGYLISAGPALSYSPQHKEAMMRAPIESMMIETDSPVFYGSGESGFRAGPKDVFRSLRLYCELKSMNEEKAAEIFYRNSQDFFGINDDTAYGTT